jgi:filamentous hemagglutinin family protein
MKRSVQGFLSRQYMCVLRRCAWENALSHFITATMAVSGGAAFAENIIPDGLTQTELSINGNVTDVTTKTVQGANALNSFHRFNIGNGQTVNLYLPTGTANLLNLVHDERSHFDGVLNAFKDGRIGGNVYFLNPHGIVVGAGGVLNVGNLTMATPTTQFMDSLISQAGLVNGGAVSNVLAGYIPLTDTGLIQVKGRINATNAVTLLAGNVAIDAGAGIFAGYQAQASFADLVNIQGVATAAGVEVENGVIRITALKEVNIAGKISADGAAGFDAGEIDVYANANINLNAGADVSANGQGADSSGGRVIIYAEGDALLAKGASVSANAGTSGDGGFVEFSATNTVNIMGGHLSAGAQNGQGGTILIDPIDVIWTGSGSDSFTNDGTNYQMEATNSIVLTDVVISTRKVDAADNNRANIEAAVSTGNSASITLKAPNITLNSGTKLLANANAGFSAGDISLTAEQNDHMAGISEVSANTSIDINGAILKGKNVSLTATSDASYDWGGDPAELAVKAATELSSTLFAGLTGVNLAVAKSTAISEIFIRNNSLIEAQGDGVTSGVITLAAASTAKAESLKLGLEALSKNGMQSVVNVGFVWGEVNSTATVKVDSGANIKAGTLNMSATNKATTDLTVLGISKDATLNAAAVVNKADVESTATIAAGAIIDVKDNISLLAHNENSFTSSATAMAIGSGKVGLAVNYSELKTEATASSSANLTSAGLKSLKIEALDDTVKNKSAAGTVAGSSFIASTFIEPGLDAADSAMNKLLGKVAAGPQKFDSVVGAADKPKIAAAVTYADNTHNATAFIGNGAQVTVADSVVVAAKVNDQRIRTHATASVEGKKDDENNPGVSLGFGGALALGTFNHNVNAYIGDNALVTAQHVGVISDISIPYEVTWAKWEGLTTIFSKLNSNLGIGDGLLSGWSNATVGGCVGTCIAGSVTWMDYNNVSNAYIGRGAKVNITPGGSDQWDATLTGDSSAFVGTNSTTIPKTTTHKFLSPVHVLAKSDVQGVYVAGNMSILLNGVGGEPGATAAGAAYNQVNYDTKTRAWVSEGAEIKQTTGPAVNVSVQADSNTQVTAVTPSAGRGASYGASMVLSNVTINNVTEASIDDEAKITAAQVNLNATDDVIAWALTGAVNKAESAGVGLSIAMTDVTTDTQAKIANNDSNNGGSLLTLTDGEVIANAVAVASRTDGRIESIAVAAAMASSADDDANGRPRSNATDKQAKADGVLAKAGNAIVGLVAKLPGLGSLVGPSADNVSQTEPKFGIAVSGASAVNLVNLGTSAFIDGSKITLTNSGLTSLKLSAVNDTDITAATGSAALTRANNPSSTFSAGAAGSVAVNLIGNTTEAYIKDTEVTDAQDVSVTALAGGEQLAVAIGAAVNASAKQDKAASFAGSVSLSSTNNTVSARVENATLTGQLTGAEQALNVNAYDRIKLGTGGGSLVAGGKGGIGAAISYSEISNKTEAIISDATVSQYKDVNVHALTATKIAAGAAMVGVTTADNGATLGGAFVISDIGNTVKAEISQGSNVTTSSGGKVDVLAADTTGIASFNAVIDANDAGQLNASSLDYDGAGIGQTAGAGSSIISVAGVGQAGASNVGLSFAYNKLHNQFTAAVHDSSIDSSNINVEAQSNAKMLGIAAGVGVAKDKLAVSGSLVLNEINNTVKAQVTGASSDILSADILTVTAEDKSSTGALAGNISASFGNAAIGAAIAVNDTGNSVQAKIENVEIDTSVSTTVKATNNAKINTLAATAGGSKGFALNGSAASAKIHNTTEATMLNVQSNNALSATEITAKDNSEINALSGAAAVANSAAVGIAVSVNQINNTVNASLSGGKHQMKNLEISAVSTDVIRTLAASVAVAGDAGIAGSVAINLVGGSTKAYIDNAADVIAQDNVGVIAESDHRITVAAGSLGVGVNAAGVGASVTTNSIKGDTNAYIDGASTRVTALAKDANNALTVKTGELLSGVALAQGIDIANYNQFDLKSKKAEHEVNGVAVNASSSQHIENISTNIAGGSFVGVAAAVSVNNIGGSTKAYINNAEINQDISVAGASQSVDITASNFAYDNSFIGNAAGGANAAGAGSDTHIMNRSTSAYTHDGKINATGNVAVKAFSTQGVSSLAVGGAAGANALAATLSMALFTNHTNATVDGTRVSAAGLDISADNKSNMYAITGAVAGGGNAIGGAFAVGSSDSSTTATLKNANGANRVDVSGDVNVKADNKTAIKHIVISGAGGGSAGVAGMADVNLVTNNTVATIDNSDLGSLTDKVGAVKVAATHTVMIDSVAGALAAGGSAGVGAGASVNVIKANTVATLNNSNVFASGLTSVNATSVTDVNAVAMTAGVGGTAGIGGAAAIILIGDDVSGASEQEVNQGNAGSLSKVNSFSSGDKLGDLPNTSAISATDKAAINADGKKSTLSVTGSAGNYKFKTAAEVGGSSTITTGSLDVLATDKTDTKTLVGGFGVGGLGVGGAVAVTTVKANVAANVSDTTLTTSGDVNIKALADNDQQKAIEILALAGGAGIVGLGAAVVYADITNNVEATLSGSALLSKSSEAILNVSAEDRTSIKAEAIGAAAGAAAVGVVINDASKSSTIKASLASTTVGTYIKPVFNTDPTINQPEIIDDTYDFIAVTATGSGEVSASTIGAAAGLISGAGADSRASNVSNVTAQAGGMLTLGANGINVSATDTPNVKAEAFGVSVGAAAVGASLATATAAPKVTAKILDETTFHGTTAATSGISVLATATPNNGGPSASAQAVAGTGGLLIGINATSATAKNNANVKALIGNNVTLPNRDIIIKATNNSYQSAMSTGVAAGFVAVGANMSEATAEGSTLAQLGSGTITDSILGNNGALIIAANGNDINIAQAMAGSGGVIAGNASLATTRNSAQTAAEILGSASSSAAINRSTINLTAGHIYNYEASANSVNAGVVSASGANTNNSSSLATRTEIGDNVSLNAAGIISGTAVNTFNNLGSGATGAGGGVLSGAAAAGSTTLNGTAAVKLGDNVQLYSGTDAVLNPGAIYLASNTNIGGFNQSSLSTGGAIAVAVVSDTFNATIANTVTTGKNNSLYSYGNVALGNWALVNAGNSALVNTYGLAAVGDANARSDLTLNQSVFVGENTKITGIGNVNLSAGAEPMGNFNTELRYSTFAKGYVRGVIAVPLATARNNLTSNAALTISTGAEIISGQNTTIGAYQGRLTPQVDATGHGFILGFIPVTSGSPSVNTTTTSTVTNNGSVTAGAYRNLTITINDCKDAGAYCSVVEQSSGMPVTTSWNATFDPQAYLQLKYPGSVTSALGTPSLSNTGSVFSGLVSATPVGAITLGGLAASGGTVTLNADSIVGNGAITSYGGPSITVNNYSPNYLILNNAKIPDLPGANIIYTGAAGAAQASAAGLTLTTDGAGAAKTITINQAYSEAGYTPALILQEGAIDNLGGLISITNATGSLLQSSSNNAQQVVINVPNGAYVLAPTSGIANLGQSPAALWNNSMNWPGGNPNSTTLNPIGATTALTPANLAIQYVANAMFNADGTYTNAADFSQALIGVAGQITSLASTKFNTYNFNFGSSSFNTETGSVLFFADASCKDAGCGGFNNYGYANNLSPIGSFVSPNGWNSNSLYFPSVDIVPSLTRSVTNYPAATAGVSNINAAKIIVNAQYIDISGQLNAGVPTNVSIDLPSSLTEPGGALQIADVLYGLNPGQSEFALYRDNVTQAVFNSPTITNTNNTYTQIGKYNAASKQISLNNVNASSTGASIVLNGGILSTTTLGNIHVNAGLGNVQVNNQTGMSLVVKNINVGSAAIGITSSVEITDTLQSRVGNVNNHWLYKYTPSGALTVYNGTAATAASALPQLSNTPGGSTAFYQPVQGLVWQWENNATLSRAYTLTQPDSNGNGGGILDTLGNWVWDMPAGSPNNPWTASTGTALVQAQTPVFKETISGGVTHTVYHYTAYHGCDGSSCNYDFAQNGYDVIKNADGTYSRGGPAGIWSFIYPTAAQLKLTSSVKADNPIKIDFSGNATGLLNINSNAAVTLAGQITNPNGSTTISSLGAINDIVGGSLSSGDLTLNTGSLTAGIGRLDRPLSAILSAGASVNATGGRDGVYLNFNSDALIDQIMAGTQQNGLGNVSITTAGDMLAQAGNSLIVGNDITLASPLGAIGRLGTTAIAAAPISLAASGVVNVSALNDIAIKQNSGDLNVGSITSVAGNVGVNVANGALLNASGQTSAQALSDEQVRQVWETLHLTTADGAEQNIVDGTITPLYLQYWRLINNGTVANGVFTLNSATVALYTPLAAAALGVATPDTAQVQSYANGLYQNVTTALTNIFDKSTTIVNGKPVTTTVNIDLTSLADFQSFNAKFGENFAVNYAGQLQTLAADAVWTEAQLTNAINRTALAPSQGSVGNASPNISGRELSFTASNIGKLSAPVNISLADLQSGTLSAAQQEALANAFAPGDVVPVDANGNVVALDSALLAEFKIGQVAPLFVDAPGDLTANAADVIYIQSTRPDLNISSVTAGGNVILAAPQSILSIGAFATQINTTGDLTLTAGSGNLGSAANYLTFQLNGGKLNAASAGQNAWLQTLAGDMTIGRVFALDTASLKAPGSILSSLPGVAISANNIILNAGRNVGSAASYFSVQNGSSGTLLGSAGGDAWLYGTNSPLQGVNFTAEDDLTVTAENDLSVVSLVSNSGNVAAASAGNADIASIKAINGDVAITAAGINLQDATSGGKATLLAGVDGVVIKGNLNSTDDVTITSAAGLAVKGLVDSGAALKLQAGNDVLLDGGSIVASDALHITAGTDGTGNVDIRTALNGGNAVDTASTLDMTAANDIIVAGRIRALDKNTLKAGDDIQLAGGSLASNGQVSLVAGTDGTGSVDVHAATDGGNAIDTLSDVIISAANDINITGVTKSIGAHTLNAQDDIKITGGSLIAQGPVSLTAGTDGTGSINIDAEAAGGFAVDTASTLDMTAANDIIVAGRIRALDKNTLKAGDDIQLAGGSLASNGQVSLVAGTDGTGSVDVNAAADGGNAIYTAASIDIAAADDINLSGNIRADRGLAFDMINGGFNLIAGTLSTGGLFNMAAKNSMTVGGNIFGGAGVGLSTTNDVLFTGGNVTSNNEVTIVAGTDGSGSIFGSATNNVDIMSLGALTLQAADTIGAGSALVAEVTDRATLLASNINVDISTTPLSNPLTLLVSDIGGGPAANVLMNLASSSQITFDKFNVDIAEITADTPSLQVPNGKVTNYAVFNMPLYSTRVDTLRRLPTLGHDVNAFTLDGNFSINSLMTSVDVDAFILLKNPNLQVAGSPTSVVVNTTELVMQDPRLGVYGKNPLRFDIGSFGLALPDENSDGNLVRVIPDGLGKTSQLAPAKSKDKKEI